ncbi:hypothetical protein C0J52_08116 [Blattella germanica]|nr:hypothetical protein C0J52_08116 [Blattella germanica]
MAVDDEFVSKALLDWAYDHSFHDALVVIPESNLFLGLIHKAKKILFGATDNLDNIVTIVVLIHLGVEVKDSYTGPASVLLFSLLLCYCLLINTAYQSTLFGLMVEPGEYPPIQLIEELKALQLVLKSNVARFHNQTSVMKYQNYEYCGEDCFMEITENTDVAVILPESGGEIFRDLSRQEHGTYKVLALREIADNSYYGISSDKYNCIINDSPNLPIPRFSLKMTAVFFISISGLNGNARYRTMSCIFSNSTKRASNCLRTTPISPTYLSAGNKIINDKLKINGKNYDLDHLENGFRNAENLEQIHNRRHSFRARSNSPIRNYNDSPNWLLRRRRFSSSERGRQEEEIEQLNYRKPGSPTTRTSTNDGIENSRKSRSEKRRSRDTRKTNYSNEHGMSASAVEFRPSTRRKSKSPDGPNRDVEGTDITRLRSVFAMFTKQDQRSWLKIECARGRNARQCYEILQDVCGENALPYRTVARWVKAFNEGRQNVTDMPRSGHTTVSEENVQNVNALVLADRNSTIRQLANDTRLAPSTVLKILKKHLQMRSIFSKTVRDTALKFGTIILDIP